MARPRFLWLLAALAPCGDGLAPRAGADLARPSTALHAKGGFGAATKTKKAGKATKNKAAAPPAPPPPLPEGMGVANVERCSVVGELCQHRYDRCLDLRRVSSVCEQGGKRGDSL